ncbi:MAG TPA: phytanoyl-CoA dioxygenase family protein [Fimbriimonadaceae bacterium]|nr:phytanoyl-CoA dioxygenase family protein [Fimbriimonadaceae bacterium]
MQLNEEQVRFFHTFGFVLLPALFTAEEMTALSDAAEQIFVEDAGEHPFLGDERQQIQGFVERRPELISLIDDARVYGVVKTLLQSELIWIGSDGNRYVGATGWHPDGSNLTFPRIKVAFYLDPLGRESGALRVIPGSHRDPLHHALAHLLQRGDATITPYGVQASVRDWSATTGYASPPEDIPSYGLETHPGDVVFFDQNIWHSSFGGAVGRRMFTLNFGSTPTTEEQWTFLEQMYWGQIDHVRTRQLGRREWLYGQDVVGSQRPLVRQLFAPLIQRGFR